MCGTPAALRNDSATDDACALTTSRLRALRSSKMRRTGSLSVDASKVGSRSRSCGADDGGAGLSAKAATEARTDGVARRRAWRDASARSSMVSSVDGDFAGEAVEGAFRGQMSSRKVVVNP